MLTLVTEGEGPLPSSRRTSQPLPTPPVPPPSPKSRAPILVQLAEVCLEQQLPGLASECLAAFPREVRRQMLANYKKTLPQYSLLYRKLRTSFGNPVRVSFLTVVAFQFTFYQVQEASLFLRKEALSCWLTVQQLGGAEESYTRSAVEVRWQLPFTAMS